MKKNTTTEANTNLAMELDVKSEMSKAAYLNKMKVMFAETPGNLAAKKIAMNLVRNANETGFDVYAEVNLDDVFADMTYQRDHKDRAKKIAAAWDYKKCSALILNVRSDGSLAIIDGYTHYDAARQLGIQYLPARILCGLSVEEEAEIFASQGEGITKPDPYDILKANLVFGEEIDTEIKRLCDKYSLELKPSTSYRKRSSARVVTCLTHIRDIMTCKNGKEKSLNVKGRDAVDQAFKLINETGLDRYNKSHIRAMISSLSYTLMDEAYKDRDVYGIIKKNYMEADLTPSLLISYANIVYPGMSDCAGMKALVTDLVEEKYSMASLKETVRELRVNMK